jgi:hypothetical protein
MHKKRYAERFSGSLPCWQVAIWLHDTATTPSERIFFRLHIKGKEFIFLPIQPALQDNTLGTNQLMNFFF